MANFRFQWFKKKRVGNDSEQKLQSLLKTGTRRESESGSLSAAAAPPPFLEPANSRTRGGGGRRPPAAAASGIPPESKESPSVEETVVFSLYGGTCKIGGKNGGESSAEFVKVGNKERRRRDCGSPRRPHCEVHRPERPPQQGLHGKGPRDRRVRLAAHTAIQFYDVQDRLGYDRPSKAVDWLIKKAKPAIDELAELPAWKPNFHHNHRSFESGDAANLLDDEDANIGAGPSSNKRTAMMMMMMPPATEKDNHFLPPSLDSDAIADTIKSFFPMVAASEPHNSSASMQFQSFPHPPQPAPHQSSDLRLSLQSIQQDPTTILLHHQNHQSQHHHQTPPPARALFAGFDSSDGWSDQQQQQRFPVWNSAGEAAPCPTGGGFLFNSPPPQFQQLLLGGQSHYFSSTSSSQRGPLQSSYSPSVRAWMDPSSAGFDPNQHYHHQSPLMPIYHHPSSSLSGLGFSAGDGEFSGFRIPARIQGEEEEEEHDGISDRPSSASSDSRR